MVYFDAEPGEQDLNHALDAAKQAVLLDDRDAVAHFALGRAYVVRQQYDAALEELETSISLNPNLAQAHCGLGDALTYSERLDDALRHFDEAIRLSPRDPYRWGFMNYRSIAHLFRGEYEEAAKWAKKALGVPIAQYVANANLVAALGHLDCPEETRAAVEELFRKKPEFSCRFAKKHHLFYIKSEEQKERYVNGLRRAGIPE
jgi:tetratricopeptide (TPR) repeat protein